MPGRAIGVGLGGVGTAIAAVLAATSGAPAPGRASLLPAEKPVFWADQMRAEDGPVSVQLTAEEISSVAGKTSMQFVVSILARHQACVLLTQPELASVTGDIVARLGRVRVALGAGETKVHAFSLPITGLANDTYSLRVAYAWKCGATEKGAGVTEQGLAVSDGMPSLVDPDALHYAAVGQEEVLP